MDDNISLVSYGTAPALNTWITPEIPGAQSPFDHAGRLFDKLLGAVEINLDNATADSRLQAAKNSIAVQQVYGATGSILPPSMATWVSRNSGLLSTIVVVAVIFMLGIVFRNR